MAKPGKKTPTAPPTATATDEADREAAKAALLMSLNEEAETGDDLFEVPHRGIIPEPIDLSNEQS